MDDSDPSRPNYIAGLRHSMRLLRYGRLKRVKLALDADEATLGEALQALEVMRDDVESWTVGNGLSTSERRMLQGAGARRYGLIDKISDIISTNPQFIPSNVNETQYKELMRRFEIVRNMSLVTRQLLRLLLDIQLVMGDEAYRLALSYYGAVRDAAKRRVLGAQELFNILRQFFVSLRRSKNEPTEQEEERDFRALLHGVKDGKIIIENERPHLTGGKHIVVDETHKEKEHWKATEEGKVE